MEGCAGETMGDIEERVSGRVLAFGKRIGEEKGGNRRDAILGSASTTVVESGHGKCEGKASGRGWMYSGEYFVMKSQYSWGKASRSKRNEYRS